MAKGEETRQHIIEKSAPLFNKLGFAKASLSDLMTATGLEKGGIYRHFESKEALACEAFDYACKIKEQDWFDSAEKAKPGWARLEKFILGFSSTRSKIDGGCPIFNTAIEHDDGNIVLKKKAVTAYERWITRLISFIDQAKENGELEKSRSSRKTAIFIFSTLEGALAVQRLTGSKDLLSQQGRLVIQCLLMK